MKCVHTCSYIPFFFYKTFWCNRNNNSNVKTLKIIINVIFALFVLEKIKFEEMFEESF